MPRRIPRSLIRVLALSVLVIPALLASSASAQDEIVGNWEGTIAGQLNMIFHVTETEGGYAATLDVPQQNTTGLPMDSVEFDGTTLRMTLDLVGGVYEGTLQEDGTIAGRWTQAAAPQPQPLDLTRQEDNG